MRSLRDGTPCEGREARFLHRSYRESNPGPSRGSPLHYRCATLGPLLCEMKIEIKTRLLIASVMYKIY